MTLIRLFQAGRGCRLVARYGATSQVRQPGQDGRVAAFRVCAGQRMSRRRNFV